MISMLKDTFAAAIVLTAMIVVVKLTGCAPAPVAPGPQPVDAAPGACVDACARLAELGCPEAEPTPDGGSCVDVCVNVEQSGYVTLDPACIARATNCDAVNACVWEPQQ